MNVDIVIPDYDGNGIDVIWEKGSKMELSCDGDQIVIRANRCGLISLAKQMIYLAVHNVAKGSHVHYDDFWCSDMPTELVIEKTAEE